MSREELNMAETDLISRQAAIEAIKEIKDKIWDVNIPSPTVPEYIEHHQQMIHLMDECDNKLHELYLLPSAQPEQRWIPVSERMPEPRIDVWCNSDMGQMVGYYDEYVETWYGRDYFELIVTAWMPLPEPYREERTEE